MKHVAAMAAIFLLSGCALGHRPYVPPTAGAIAYLRVVAAGTTPESSARLGVATFKEAESCRGRYWLQNPTLPTEVTKSFARVPAGAPMSVAIHIPLGGDFSRFEFCAPILLFTPEAGKYYRATISAVSGGCQAKLESSSAASMAGAHEERFRRMIFSNGMDENSSFCSGG